jgi:hypothetical protein
MESGSRKPIKICDHKAIKERDRAHGIADRDMSVRDITSNRRMMLM